MIRRLASTWMSLTTFVFLGACSQAGEGNTKQVDPATIVDAGLLRPVDEDDCQEATDFDDDGLVGDCDNCRKRANPKQADRDRDGLGDACDGCDDLRDEMCGADVTLDLPGGSAETMVLGVIYEVPARKRRLYEDLVRPLCLPEHLLGALRLYRTEGSPIGDVTESWFDLKSDQYGDEGFQNEGIFIAEKDRWFYEPTASIGGWKKQYVTEIKWTKTKQGWTAVHEIAGQPLLSLSFRRASYDGKLPAYLDAYMNDPPESSKQPEPEYILSPADFEGTEYGSIDPVVYDSTWVPSGPVAKETELGLVTITWKKPKRSVAGLDLRWMELLPETGAELPGYLVWKTPSATADTQSLMHKARGYGECSAIR